MRNDATLDLSWTAVNCDHVNLSPVTDEALPLSGSRALPNSAFYTEYKLQAVGADSSVLQRYTFAVSNHSPDEVVSGHAEVHSSLDSVEGEQNSQADAEHCEVHKNAAGDFVQPATTRGSG